MSDGLLMCERLRLRLSSKIYRVCRLGVWQASTPFKAVTLSAGTAAAAERGKPGAAPQLDYCDVRHRQDVRGRARGGRRAHFLFEWVQDFLGSCLLDSKVSATTDAHELLGGRGKVAALKIRALAKDRPEEENCAVASTEDAGACANQSNPLPAESCSKLQLRASPSAI